MPAPAPTGAGSAFGVARPGIVGAEVAVDARHDLVRELGRAGLADDALADEEHEVAELVGGVAKLIAQ